MANVQRRPSGKAVDAEPIGAYRTGDSVNAIGAPPSHKAAPARATPLCSVLLIGPLPPPSGGMANQTKQLARLLGESGITVELMQTNGAIGARER